MSSEILQLIQNADFALMEIEQARVALEAAKNALELAKSDLDRAKASYDEVIARADEVGVPRAKLRKLAEERAAALSASGLISVPVNQVRAAPKPVKLAKKTGKSKDKEENSPQATLTADADGSNERNEDPFKPEADESQEFENQVSEAALMDA